MPALAGADGRAPLLAPAADACSPRGRPSTATLHLDPPRQRLHDHQRVVAERLAPAPRRAARPRTTLTIPTEEPRCAGLTNTGSPSSATSASTSPARAPTLPAYADEVDLRRPQPRHQLFEEDLVHAQRRGRDPGADVRHVQCLQGSLHGPVLPIGPVQHRKHHVRPKQPLARAETQPLALVAPDAVTADLHPARLVTRLAQAARTASAETSETSCSEERPPASTATVSAPGALMRLTPLPADAAPGSSRSVSCSGAAWSWSCSASAAHRVARP